MKFRFSLILDWLRHTNVLYLYCKHFTDFLDVAKNAILSSSSSDNLPAIVGGTLGSCVTVFIGVILALFAMRYASYLQSRFNMDIISYMVCNWPNLVNAWSVNAIWGESEVTVFF